ncbi:MAG TPA: hypothetical protein VNV25_19905 [Gemmatimonadaceae bacterium]|nr:hypothetical protein [Gemmatimonadaceae bacterium]
MTPVSAISQYSDDVAPAAYRDMTFWGYLVRLFVGDIVATFAFPLVLGPVLALSAVAWRRSGGKVSLGVALGMAAALITQIWFWSLWAAYCARVAALRVSQPVVTHGWVYYLIAFTFVVSPLAYLGTRERQMATSATEVRSIDGGTSLYQWLAIVAYVVFAAFPGLIPGPYLDTLGVLVPPPYVMRAASVTIDRDRLGRVFADFDSVGKLVAIPNGVTTKPSSVETDRLVDEQLTKGLTTADSISDSSLVWLDPEMPKPFRSEFLEGHRLYREGLRRSDLAMQIKGNELIERWYRDFWDARATAIFNRAYGGRKAS